VKFKRINDNKIQVIISKDDLENKNVQKWDLMPNSHNAQELFQEMLDQAYEECGFEVDPETQLMVEAYPMTIDSLIVTLTKVNKIDKSFFQSFIDEDLFDDYDEFEEFADVESNELIYEFKDLEEIFQLASQISPLYFGKSDLYKFQEKYYLVFKDPEKLLESSIGTIGEYGSNARFHDCLLAERGKLMIKDDALKKLSQI